MTLRVNEQLTRYYYRSGLVGEELANAVEADYLLAMGYLKRRNETLVVERKFNNNTDLSGLFLWDATEEGQLYWQDRHNG